MLIGFIETATIPAISIFRGVVGMSAANINTTAPIHEIWGVIIQPGGGVPTWNVPPSARAVKIMYQRPRSSTKPDSLTVFLVYANRAIDTITAAPAIASPMSGRNQR